MICFNEATAHDTVEEGDDIHDGAADTDMREVKELAINKFLVFISEIAL